MLRLVAVLAVACVVSGCSGPDALGGKADAEPDFEGNGASGAEGGPRISTGADAEAGPNATFVAGSAVPVDFTGFASAWMCLPTGTNSCAGSGFPGQESLGEDSARWEDALAARWSVDLEVTWDALTPVTAGLDAYAGPYTTCGDGCLQVEEGALTAEGVSPLLLAGDLNATSAAAGFVVGVSAGMGFPGVVGGVSTGQAFHVTGTLTPWYVAP